MSIKINTFECAQIGYILLVSLALILMPGADFFLTLTALIGVWVVVFFVYRVVPWYSEAGKWTLLIATMILALGIISNVHLYTTISGGTTVNPILLNSDAARFFNDALYAMDSSIGGATDIKNHGYGLLVSWLWRMTGITIVSPLVVNMLLMLFSVIMSGGISWRVLSGETCRSGQWVASCAMILIASVCYFLNSGTLLLKESIIIFSFSITAFSLTSLAKLPETGSRQLLMLILWSMGVVLLSFTRYNMLFLLIMGVMLMVKWRRRQLMLGIAMILICIACLIAVSVVFHSMQVEMSETTGKIMSGYGMNNSFFLDSDHVIYTEFIKGYFDYPWWQKVLLLPLSGAVQYLIPLPWGFGDDIHFGYTLAYAHVSYPWYVVGGLILYYFLFLMRQSPVLLRRFAVWGALVWLLPAYLFAGTVSRYTLPILSVLIPCAVYVLASWRNHLRFKQWMICYGMMLVVALVMVCIFQKWSGA